MSKRQVISEMYMRPFIKNLNKLHPKQKVHINKLSQPLEPLKFKLQQQDIQKMQQNIPLGGTQDLPFQIQRSNTGNLPVYIDYKHKRSQTYTIVRKVLGDVDILQEELAKVVSNNKIQQKAGKLVINGRHQKALNLYFHRLGF